jgi:microcystin-dependent protein
MRMILWAIAALALLGGVQPAAAVLQPYIGERMIFAGDFCPVGWMSMQGQLLPISENEVLYALIGTTYGGDGQSTFALPNAKPIFTANGGPNGQNNAAVKQCIATEGYFPQP